MSKVIAVAALFVGAALALFGAQNPYRVALHFLWFNSRPLPASLAILAAALLGILVGVLLMLPGRLASAHTTRGLRRDIGRRDEQMAHARAVPIEDTIGPDTPPQEPTVDGQSLHASERGFNRESTTR